MRWAAFESDAGELGAEIRRLLQTPGVVLVATTRGDGTPRLSPVEPFFWDEELWLPMMFASRKAADLERDPRLLVHSIITSKDGAEGEAKVRGTAVREPSGDRTVAVCRAIGEAMPWEPEPDRVELFRVDVESASTIRYLDGDQHVALWPQGHRFVRRITSATSVGEPEDETTF